MSPLDWVCSQSNFALLAPPGHRDRSELAPNAASVSAVEGPATRAHERSFRHRYAQSQRLRPEREPGRQSSTDWPRGGAAASRTRVTRLVALSTTSRPGIRALSMDRRQPGGSNSPTIQLTAEDLRLVVWVRGVCERYCPKSCRATRHSGPEQPTVSGFGTRAGSWNAPFALSDKPSVRCGMFLWLQRRQCEQCAAEAVDLLTVAIESKAWATGRIVLRGHY